MKTKRSSLVYLKCPSSRQLSKDAGPSQSEDEFGKSIEQSHSLFWRQTFGAAVEARLPRGIGVARLRDLLPNGSANITGSVWHPFQIVKARRGQELGSVIEIPCTQTLRQEQPY